MIRGFWLALGTAFAWGAQSVAMSVMVRHVSPYTVAFLKIFSAAFVLGVLELRAGGIALRLPRRTWTLAVVAGVSLAVSYGLFANSFVYLSPANVQLYMQSERLILAFCGVFIFREAASRVHWFGTLMLPVGYYWFFRDQLSHTAHPADYRWGVLLVLGTAVSWVVYALCQKRLLVSLSSRRSLVLIFSVSTLILFPLADLGTLASLPVMDSLLLAFICASSILAFACFAEALRCWEMSKIGAVISLTPVITFALMVALRVSGEEITSLGIVGAVLIILGSVLASLASRQRA